MILGMNLPDGKQIPARVTEVNVQEVIIEMIFQLGIKNMLSFNKFNAHIKKNQLFMAALEMIDSRWYQQTPRRVNKLIANMIYNHNE